MRTVGFFVDPKIAIVQTPHHFQFDIFQMNLGMGEQWPDEQRLFSISSSLAGMPDCAFAADRPASSGDLPSGTSVVFRPIR
jgi:hypothetical protein